MEQRGLPLGHVKIINRLFRYLAAYLVRWKVTTSAHNVQSEMSCYKGN